MILDSNRLSSSHSGSRARSAVSPPSIQIQTRNDRISERCEANATLCFIRSLLGTFLFLFSLSLGQVFSLFGFNSLDAI